jgi:hypothetical protein
MDYYINLRWITISIPDGLLYQSQIDTGQRDATRRGRPELKYFDIDKL